MEGARFQALRWLLMLQFVEGNLEYTTIVMTFFQGAVQCEAAIFKCKTGYFVSHHSELFGSLYKYPASRIF